MNCAQESIGDDRCIKISCEIDGISAVGYVFNENSIDAKRQQLKELIERKARQAFDIA